MCPDIIITLKKIPETINIMKQYHSRCKSLFFSVKLKFKMEPRALVKKCSYTSKKDENVKRFTSLRS